MKKADVIILAGQSNAVGVGFCKYLPKHFSDDKVAQYRKGYENIKINYFSHDKKSDGFVAVTLGCTELTKDTFGPELGMAEYLTENGHEHDVFIVKCAFGGMTLYRDWLSPSSGRGYDKDAFANQKPDVISAVFAGEEIRAGWCYNELVKLLHESLTELESRGYALQIRGFCWMQGESDADNEAHAKQYAELYGNLLRDLKAQFKEYFNGCIFADAAISSQWTLYREINEAKRRFSETHEDCVFIDTVAQGLTTENEPEGSPDTAHYDSDSTVKLGHLFAKALF